MSGLFAEPVLSGVRFFAALRMTGSEWIRMTGGQGLRMTASIVTLSEAKGLGSSPAAQNDKVWLRMTSRIAK